MNEAAKKLIESIARKYCHHMGVDADHLVRVQIPQSSILTNDSTAQYIEVPFWQTITMQAASTYAWYRAVIDSVG